MAHGSVRLNNLDENISSQRIESTFSRENGRKVLRYHIEAHLLEF